MGIYPTSTIDDSDYPHEVSSEHYFDPRTIDEHPTLGYGPFKFRRMGPMHASGNDPVYYTYAFKTAKAAAKFKKDYKL